MFIFPLGGHPCLKMLNSNVPYIDVGIPIETWIQLIQNKFIGIGNSEFILKRYNIDYDLTDIIKWFKYTWLRNGIFVFYKDTITKDFWNLVSRAFKNKTIVGLTHKGIQHDNIITVNDLNDAYEQDRVCRLFNKFL